MYGPPKNLRVPVIPVSLPYVLFVLLFVGSYLPI